MLINTDDPNIIGEAPRQEFFKVEEYYVGAYKYRSLGCYQIFHLKEDVLRLPNREVFFDGELIESWTVAQKTINGIIVIMEYYWDGDGTLRFSWENKSIVNDDCKKTYRWKYE